MTECLTCGKENCTEAFHHVICPVCKTREKTRKATTCRPCSKRTFTAEKDTEIIMLYRSGWLIKDIAKKYGVNGWVISGVLDRAEIPRRSMSRTKAKYKVNEFFFDVINEEQKAYWFGFIAADGWTSSTHKKFALCIELKASDKAHLLRFRSDIGSTHPILERTQKVKNKKHRSARIAIGNRHLVKTLIGKGIVPGKTLTFRYPAIPSHLHPHFIRGYFDGDGSLTFSSYSARPEYRALQFSILGNKNFLRDVQKIIQLNCNVNRTRLYMNHDGLTHIMAYGGNTQVPRILDFLYADATVFLPRKKKRYTKWLQSRQ